MKHTQLPPNFIYPNNITEKTYLFGGGQIDNPVLREDGDWRDFVPEAEEQNRNGVESSACFTEAQQHGIATLQNEVWNLNFNYASRFNALIANGTLYGGNPVEAAESIRKDGLVPEAMLPFDESIVLWDDFHSWKGGNEKACRLAGKLWLEKWEPKYHIVFQKHETIEVKYAKLKEALKRGPVPISMYAWTEIDGVYFKPEGQNDTHFIEAVFLESDGHLWIWDTYQPFLKKIAPNTNFDFAMQWSVNKLPDKKKFNLLEMIIELISKLWKK